MRRQTAILISTLIIALVATNIQLLIHLDRLQGEKTYYEKEIKSLNSRIDELSSPHLEKTTLSHDNGNCTGTVYNTGLHHAYNVKIVFKTGSVTAKIDLPDINGRDYIQFNEPFPSSIHGFYFIELEWTDKP